MHTKFTVLTYHYVRDLKKTAYPKIKGLDFTLFQEQLHYLKKHYHFITVGEVLNAVHDGGELPPKSLLLTFDDNYSDHYQNVFPLLEKSKIQGCFYTPVEAVKDRKVLEVNKIHYLLAAASAASQLITNIKKQLDTHREEYNLGSYESYYKKLAIANRWDTEDIRFIKKLLQSELSRPLRNKILNNLVETFLNKNEEEFSNELYMNQEQISTMMNAGMHFGFHGSSHSRLNLISQQELENEMQTCREFFSSLGADMNQLTIAYPYGDFNDQAKKAAVNAGCKLGFTVKPDIANLGNYDSMELPRLDTNDLPQNSGALPDDWHKKG